MLRVTEVHGEQPVGDPGLCYHLKQMPPRGSSPCSPQPAGDNAASRASRGKQEASESTGSSEGMGHSHCANAFISVCCVLIFISDPFCPLKTARSCRKAAVLLSVPTEKQWTACSLGGHRSPADERVSHLERNISMVGSGRACDPPTQVQTPNSLCAA